MKPTHEQLVKAKIPCEETGIEIRRTLCDICSPTDHCGINAYVKDGKVIKVEGTKEHPYNHGRLCTKGGANRQYIYREDRLRTPLRRVGERGEGKFEPISWDEAYDEIARNLLRIRETDGADSVAFFSGFSKWYRPWMHRFAHAFGSMNYGSESSVCFLATKLAWLTTAGTFVSPDFDNSNTILGWAMNPYYSAHVLVPWMRQLKAVGKKFIIVDPRRTPATEQLADIHLQLRPGTDGALAMGMANLIIERGWLDRDYIEKYTYGFEEYAAYVRQFDLARTAEITGLDPRDIERATELYATNGPAAIFETASPVTHHINGFQNYRAIVCLNALTGNFDRAGGAIPAEDTFYHQVAEYSTREEEFTLARQPGDRSQMIGAQRFPVWAKLMPEFSAADLLRQMTEGTPYPIKAIFGVGMNAKMFPETPKMYEALKKLDFFAATDLFMTDTCKYADIVLPVCSSFERGEFKAYPGGYAFYTKPVIEPLYESRSDTDIFRDLSRVMHLNDELLEAGYEAGVRYMLQDLSITVDDLLASEFPVHVPEARAEVPGEYTAAGMKTPTGKFEFRSSIIAEFEESHGLHPIPTWENPLSDDADAADYPFVLSTGCRLPNVIHSRFHGVPWARSMRKEPMADIHPEDAAALGIREGDRVEIYNAVGSLEVAAHLTWKVRRGDVHLYHGYSEANANDLVGMQHIDPYSGYPGYKSNRCNLRRKP